MCMCVGVYACVCVRVTQPMRNGDSGSAQSLLGQTRCEEREGPEQTAKVGRKGSEN